VINVLRQSQTAVFERNTTFCDNFVTEPFEVAWALEGRFYVRMLDKQGGARLTFHPQVSPDGLNWLDLPDATASLKEENLITWPVREFGHWMRLRVTFDGEPTTVKVLIYMALKG
jgi:hypothetical protein